MKKVLALALGLLLLGACGTAAPKQNEVVRISEKLFVAQVNDVFLNQEEYLGKTIALEGMFQSFPYENGNTYYYVYRNGPGCCVNDGQVGFEVAYKGKLPADNDWVAAEGRLEKYTEDGTAYLHLSLSKLEILPERGQENVTQ